MTFALATFLKPFVALAVLMSIRPLVKWFERNLPDGKMKRILFFSWS